MNIERTQSKSVACNGEQSPNGHPKIYLAIDEEIGKIACPYCSKIFELAQT